MPPIIHCVRHAQGFHNLSYANHNIPDPGLTPEGEEQARALGASFPGSDGVDLILSSPLRRAIQTALSAFTSRLEKGNMQILAWPEVQEASALPCDTGSGLDTIRSEFKDLPVDLDLVQPGWHVKVRTLLYATNAVLSAWSALIVTQEGRWGPSARTLLERAQVARGWLMKRPEREIVVVSHGCFLHFLTDDWVNSINPQATSWGNCELRSFTFENVESRPLVLCETAESRKSRGLETLALSYEEQLGLRGTTLKIWIEWGVIFS